MTSDIKIYEPLWGSWYVDNIIGEGSFGKVYKVHKEEFGKVYYAAVKMISIPQSEADILQAKSDGLNDESARSYFQAFVTDIIQEIDLMSAFRGNTNIVSLEDHKVIEKSGVIGWDILIRMELLTTLSSYVNTKPLTPNEVVKLGIDICRALELCAMRNTIHRDIKPDNIFVSKYGDYKLGDFGIARQIERTMSGLSKKGTYTYMAPEVFKGESYGASVDLYSLGIVMYRYLNRNRTPFLPPFPEPITPHDRDDALMRRMNGEAIPEICDIDPELNSIVLKACAHDRNERFRNAQDMRKALEALPEFPEARGNIIITESEITDTEAETITIDDGRTKGVFSVHMISEQQSQEISDPDDDYEIPEKFIAILANSSCVCFAIMAALAFMSNYVEDKLTFFPVYALCISQCFVKFRSKILNAGFTLLLVMYILFAVFIDFKLFDYSLFIFTLSFMGIMAAGKGNKTFNSVLCAIMLMFALASGILFANTSRETHYVYISGAAAVPFLTLAIFPTAMLLTGRHSKIGISLLSALHFFSLMAFVIYIAAFANSSSILLYIVNANFPGFSAERFTWWRYGRFLGLVLQVLSLYSLNIISMAEFIPGTLDFTQRHKIFHMAIIFAAVMIIGLVVSGFIVI